jgi:hypothetical protein
MVIKMTIKITDRSLQIFLEYAKDADNWSGTPPIGLNVSSSKEDRGNITQLKRANLITTFNQDGESWIQFTEAGKALAKEHGIEVI